MRHKFFQSFLLLLLVSLSAAARPRFEDAQDLRLWNHQDNAASVRLDTIGISDAHVSADYTMGGARSYSEAPQQWTVGALARTYKHTQRFSMYGDFSFRQYGSYEHCGSMLYNAERYPVNIYEFTPGNKTQQQYKLSGAIGVALTPQWILGAGVSFESVNCAKLKDLRYTQYYLDFTLSPSLVYRGEEWTLGVSLNYARNTQNSDAEEIGLSGNLYRAFLDKGNYMGVEGIWTAGFLHLDEAGIMGFPIAENSFGAGLQAQRENLLAHFDYCYRSGFIGEKQQIWFNYFQHDYTLSLAYHLPSAHWLRLTAQASASQNNENILEKVSENGVTTTVTLGALPIYRKHSYALTPSYTYAQGDWRADIELCAHADKSLSTQLYPTVYGYSQVGVQFDGRVRRSLGNWDVSAGLYFSKAWEFVDKDNVDASVRPYFYEKISQMEKEYNQAYTGGMTLGVRYYFPFALYLDLSGSYRHNFQTRYLASPSRGSVVFTVGYLFK